MNRQIKIVGIISSPRINGSTALLVREALRGAEEAGAETVEIFLTKYSIEFCKGCSRCMAEGECVISDDLAALRNELASADGIILASPNYANSYNAIMKQFLERLGLFEFLTSNLFGEKHVAAISTAGGSGAKKVAKGLTCLPRDGIFKRGYVSGRLGVNLNGRPITQRPDAIAKARNLGKVIALDIRKGRKYPLQNIFSRLLINLFVKPNFIKLVVNAKENQMKAVYENLRWRELI